MKEIVKGGNEQIKPTVVRGSILAGDEEAGNSVLKKPERRGTRVSTMPWFVNGVGETGEGVESRQRRLGTTVLYIRSLRLSTNKYRKLKVTHFSELCREIAQNSVS
jgi:hypothetical protein